MPDNVWTNEPNGEYNEQFTVQKDVKITIYSDRDGQAWMCRLDNGEDLPLEATDVYRAREEALRTD